MLIATPFVRFWRNLWDLSAKPFYAIIRFCASTLPTVDNPVYNRVILREKSAMTDNLTSQGIAALRAGDKQRARQLFAAAVSADPRDERAWLWLSGAVDADAQRVECLRRVLALNPDNDVARKGLQALGVAIEPQRSAQSVPSQVQSAPAAPPPLEETDGNWLKIFLRGTFELVMSFLFTSQFGAARWVLIPVALLLCVCCLCVASGRSLSLSNPMAGQDAPDFTLNDLYGNPVQLSNLRGRVVLVNFWATWCGPCRAELPDLAAVHSAHQADGLTILGVNDGEQAETVSSFLKNNWIPYPVLLDSNQRISSTYRVSAIPMSFLIDRRGVMRTVLSGSRSRAAFEQALLPLLAEKP